MHIYLLLCCCIVRILRNPILLAHLSKNSGPAGLVQKNRWDNHGFYHSLIVMTRFGGVRVLQTRQHSKCHLKIWFWTINDLHSPRYTKVATNQQKHGNADCVTPFNVQSPMKCSMTLEQKKNIQWHIRQNDFATTIHIPGPITE